MSALHYGVEISKGAAIDQFRSAIVAAGLTPPETIEADGKLRRFSSNGKPKDDTGWYVLHGGAVPAGVIGDWRTGLHHNWRADIGRSLTPAEDAAHRAKMEAMKMVRDAEEARRRADATKKAAALWRAATPASDDHPYLVRKQVGPVATLREIDAGEAAAILGYTPKSSGEALAGRVLVAPVKIGDALATCELIDGDGRKSAVYGGAKAGGYWAAQPLPDGDGTGLTLYIGEGVATVLSVREATAQTCIAALSSGNLVAVAVAMRKRYPAALLALVGDLVKATGEPDAHAIEAAQKAGAQLTVPDFGEGRAPGDTDFNDMAVRHGADAVRACIGAAIAAGDCTPAPAVPAAPGARAVKIRCGAQIKPQPITWLWEGWLPAGKLTILAGAAGTGKTTLALGFAAAITTGGKWPDGSHCPGKGNVLIWSSEDVADDTLVPRLIASGADLNRCHFIEGITENGESAPFDPAQDILDLHRAVSRIGGVSLLLIDPIVSAVAGDMHKANDVRRSLQAVVDFAEAHQCAVIGITHFAKGGAGKSPQDRVIGSQAFGALARMVLVAAKEEDGTRRVLARAKSNIAPDDGGVTYSLGMKTINDGIEATHAVWEGIIDGTAREILGDVEHDADGDGGERKDAEQFLCDLLASGPVSTKQVKADAAGAGYSWRTIERAKRDLCIEAAKAGMKDGWQWFLPKTAKNTEDRHSNYVAVFEKSGGLRGGLRDLDDDPPIKGAQKEVEETKETTQNKAVSLVSSMVSSRSATSAPDEVVIL